MGFFNRMTGKAVEEKITEYSEVYGEVLLGLHRDLERQQRRLQECQERLEAQTGQIEQLQASLSDDASLQRQLAAQAGQIRRLRRLCVLSYVCAFGIGVAVWLIRW